jgi:hypothetical protein
LFFLPLAVVIADARGVIELHRAAVRARRGPLLAALALALFLIVLWAHRRTGYYPNQFQEVVESDTFGERFALVARNAAHNLGQLASWSDFPHDYFHGYGLVLVAITAVLALRGRADERRVARIVAVSWALTFVFICLLYKNYYWCSHRLLALHVVLCTGVILSRLLALERRVPRLAGLGALLALNLLLSAAVLRDFVRSRGGPGAAHPITALGNTRPGDLVFSSMDFRFLVENPRCQLMSEIPEDPAQLAALIEKARPRFVVLPAERPLGVAGYRRATEGGPRVVWLREAEE